MPSRCTRIEGVRIYGQNNITVPISTGSNEYSKMDMRKSRVFGNDPVGYGTLPHHYLMLYIDHSHGYVFERIHRPGQPLILPT